MMRWGWMSRKKRPEWHAASFEGLFCEEFGERAGGRAGPHDYFDDVWAAEGWEVLSAVWAVGAGRGRAAVECAGDAGAAGGACGDVDPGGGVSGAAASAGGGDGGGS